MNHSLHAAVTLSIRIPLKIKGQLEELASATGRTKSFLTADAIQHYLELQVWQVNAVKKAVKKADSKKAKFIEHEKVVHWLTSWGSQDESESPE